MKKVCNVVMLPTEKATWPNCIWLGRISNQLHLDASYNDKVPQYQCNPIDDSMLPQHLYIWSENNLDKDDEQGFYYCLSTRKIVPITKSNARVIYYKKIIATTDTSLNLPLIPKGFIKKYVELQGKIDKVMVEFNDIKIVESAENYDDNILLVNNKEVFSYSHKFPEQFTFEKQKYEGPKIRRDNTIIISKYNNMFDDKFANALQEFQKQYPSVTSADLQTFALGWQSAIKNCL